MTKNLLPALFLSIFAGLAAWPGANAYARDRYQRSRTTSDEPEMKADHRKLLLTTGEDRAVKIDFDVASHDAIVAGNPAVVFPQLVKVGDERQIVFKPLKAGETNVTVRDADGHIHLIFFVRVTGSNLLRVAGEVRDLLRDVEGIDIRIVGPKVVIEGEVLVPGDYGKLYTVISDKAYADYVLNLTTLSPITMQVIAKRIQDDINTFAQGVHTRVVNGVILLEGTVDNDSVAARALKIATDYLPDVRPGDPLAKDPTAQIQQPPRKLIQTFLIVSPPPQNKRTEKLVRVTIYFVELQKDYSNIFGFLWQPGFTADPSISIGQTATGAAGASGPSFSATISSLLPKLQSAQAAGYARILRTGTVIVRSGQPAKLSNQQEFTFAQAGANGVPTFGSKPVGLVVAVTPLVMGSSEDVQLDLDLDQSSVVGRAPTTGGPPTTAIQKVNTKIYVHSGESAAVAGITSSDVGTDFNKDLPTSGTFSQGTDPLFTLGHSKGYRKEKSQFVIFVTPQIVDNASDGTQDLKKNFRVRVN